MANIWIKKNGRSFDVTVDEFPEISFTEKTYDKARNRAVELVKAEIQKNVPQKTEEEPQTTKVRFGFAA